MNTNTAMTPGEISASRLLHSLKLSITMLLKGGVEEKVIIKTVGIPLLEAKTIAGFELWKGESEGEMSDRFTEWMRTTLGYDDDLTDAELRILIIAQVGIEQADIIMKERMGIPVKKVALRSVPKSDAPRKPTKPTGPTRPTKR